MKIEINRDLPKSWILTTVGEIAEYVQRGKSPKYIDWSELPVVNQKCIRWDGINSEYLKFIHPEQWDKWSKERFLQEGDILWNSTGTGTIGRATIYRGLPEYQQAVVDTHVTIVRTKNYNQKLLHYWIMSPVIRLKIDRMYTGSTNQVELSKSEVISTSLPLPPLNEQKRIVTKIEALQTKSTAAKEQLQQIKPLLDRFRQSVLAAAFRGDLTKTWREQNPDVEPAEVLLERIRIERRRRWEEAELEKMKAQGKVPKDDNWKKKYKKPEAIDTEGLPKLPDGWCWGILELIADAIDPQPSHRTPPEVPNGIPYVSIGDVFKDGTINFEKARKVSSKVLKEHRERYTLRKGDFIFGKIGTLGKPLKLPLDKDYTLSANIILVQPQQNYAVSDWLFFFMKSPFVEDLLTKNSRATSQAAFGIKKIRLMFIPLTPLEEQKEIVRRIESLFKLADTIEQQYQQAETQLETLNQSILAKAFRGELVPQDPNDEPASVLLERIKAEKTKQETKGKKTKKKDSEEPKIQQLNLDL